MFEPTWKGQPMGIPVRDLPSIAYPLAVVSLLIPVTAWRLQRHGWISSVAQYRIEIGWLTTLGFGSIAALLIRVIDQGSRHGTRGLAAALIFGYPVLVVLVSLITPAIRQWRQASSLVGYSLLKSILTAAFRVVLYLMCLNVAAFLMVFCMVHVSRAPLAYLFLPDEFGFVILPVAITMQWFLPWCVEIPALIYRECQEEYAVEQVLLDQLQTDSESLLIFAAQVVSTALANTVGRESVQYASARISTDSVKPTGLKKWMAYGKLRMTGAAGIERNTTWVVYIIVMRGKLQSTYVNFDVTDC